jgi:hypothetical protein
MATWLPGFVNLFCTAIQYRLHSLHILLLYYYYPHYYYYYYYYYYALSPVTDINAVSSNLIYHTQEGPLSFPFLCSFPHSHN